MSEKEITKTTWLKTKREKYIYGHGLSFGFILGLGLGYVLHGLGKWGLIIVIVLTLCLFVSTILFWLLAMKEAGKPQQDLTHNESQDSAH